MSMPEDAINVAASKLAGAVAPLNTIESLAGSKPVSYTHLTLPTNRV